MSNPYKNPYVEYKPKLIYTKLLRRLKSNNGSIARETSGSSKAKGISFDLPSASFHDAESETTP